MTHLLPTLRWLRAHPSVVAVALALVVGAFVGRRCRPAPEVVTLPDPGDASAVEDRAEEVVEGYEAREGERADECPTAAEGERWLR